LKSATENQENTILDDSGPYEEIDDDSPSVRPPLAGPFPSYIPFDGLDVLEEGFDSDCADEATKSEEVDERLI